MTLDWTHSGKNLSVHKITLFFVSNCIYWAVSVQIWTMDVSWRRIWKWWERKSKRPMWKLQKNAQEDAPRQISVTAFGCTQPKWTYVIWKRMDSSGHILARQLECAQKVYFGSQKYSIAEKWPKDNFLSMVHFIGLILKRVKLNDLKCSQKS